jgi:hypothetical protein
LNHRNASKVCFIKDFWAELRNKVYEAIWEPANPTEKLKKENVRVKNWRKLGNLQFLFARFVVTLK